LLTADELDLGEWADYLLVGDDRSPQNQPAKIIIVAETLRVSRPLVIFAQGTPRGTDLVIVCHQAIFDSPLDIQLGFVNGNIPGQGGDFLFAADSVQVRGQTASPTDLVTVKTGMALRINQVGDYKSGGGKGQLTLSSVTPTSVQGYERELSEWKLQMLEYLQYKIHDARRRSDYTAITQLVRKYQALPDWPTSESFRPALTALLSQLESVVAAMNVLSWQLQIPAETGAVRTLTLFREGPNWQPQIAPTDLLLRTRQARGRSVLGIIRKDPTNPERVQLILEAELLASSAAIAQVPEKNTEGVLGMFTDWSLTSPKIAAVGLRNYSVTVVDRVVQIQLTLDPDIGTIALWQLGQDPGIPLSFEYQCNKDSSIKGELPLFLSLSRRNENNVSIAGDQVTNQGTTEVAIQYVLSGGTVVNLNPALVVPPQATVKLVLPNGEGNVGAKGAVALPADSILYTGRDPFSLADFDTTDTANLIQKVNIENLLPAYDEKLSMALDYVEVTVFYTAGSQEASAGPYHLSPRGAEGSTIVVPFLKPGSGAYSFQVKGTAFYDKGRSSAKFDSTPTSDSDIKIDQTLLNAGVTPPVSH